MQDPMITEIESEGCFWTEPEEELFVAGDHSLTMVQVEHIEFKSTAKMLELWNRYIAPALTEIGEPEGYDDGASGLAWDMWSMGPETETSVQAIAAAIRALPYRTTFNRTFCDFTQALTDEV